MTLSFCGVSLWHIFPVVHLGGPIRERVEKGIEAGPCVCRGPASVRQPQGGWAWGQAAECVCVYTCKQNRLKLTCATKSLRPPCCSGTHLHSHFPFALFVLASLGFQCSRALQGVFQRPVDSLYWALILFSGILLG